MPKEYKNIVITSISDLDVRMTEVSAEGFSFDGIFEFNNKSSVAVFSRDTRVLALPDNANASVRDGFIEALRLFARQSPMHFIHCVNEIRSGGNPHCPYSQLSEYKLNVMDKANFSTEAIEAVMRYVRGNGIDMEIVDK